jgi:type IV secretion system protein VirB2
MKTLKQLKTRCETLLLMGLCALPQASHAATIEGILNNVVSYLQGTIAKSLGIAAIVISGYLCIAKQSLPKETFIMILVGMGLIFGGTSLYNTLIG